MPAPPATYNVLLARVVVLSAIPFTTTLLPKYPPPVTASAPPPSVVACVAVLIITVLVAVTPPKNAAPSTVMLPLENVSLLKSLVSPTIKFFAIAAPPFTCSVPVIPVALVTAAVPSTIRPARTAKSLSIDCSAIFIFL